jgi:hypothetical protein
MGANHCDCVDGEGHASRGYFEHFFLKSKNLALNVVLELGNPQVLTHAVSVRYKYLTPVTNQPGNHQNIQVLLNLPKFECYLG